MQYWDLPGVGTALFPKSTYLQKMNIDRYHFFLLFFATTVQESDIWLALELQKREKKFAFVRTKIDELQNQPKFRKNPELLPGEIDKTKEKYLQTLKNAGVKVTKLYAISSVELELGDFNELVKDVGDLLPGMKKWGFIMSLKLKTEETITNKKEMLLENTWRIATLVGLTAGVPNIPGVDVPVNIAMLATKVQDYLNAFQLDTASLDKLGSEAYRKLKAVSEIKENGITEFITQSFEKAVAVGVAETAVKWLLPVVGSILTGMSAGTLSNQFLKRVICDLADDALTIRKFELEQFDTLKLSRDSK